MSQVVTLIPGDWVGGEVAAVVRRLLAAAGADIDWEVVECGERTYRTRGESLPDEALESIRRNKVCLKGRLFVPPEPNKLPPTIRLRQGLDLFASIRPIRNVWELPARHPTLDLLLVRESTEDVYAGREHMVVPGVVETLKVTTTRGSERIALTAFTLARQLGRKKVTTVHKANIMKMADGLWLETSRRVAQNFPDIEHNDIIVDNLAMQLVSRPQKFDVLLLGNLFGDIIADLCTGLVGGICQVPSIARGEGDIVVYEAPHGRAPELVGKDLANPLILLTPALSLLRDMGKEDVATRLMNATLATLRAGIKTPDLGGTAHLSEFESAILSRLARAQA